MKRARTTYYTDLIRRNSDDSRKLFKCAKSLFNQEADLTFPGYNDKTKLANDIGKFFAQKIERIRTALDTAASNLCPTATEPIYTSCPTQLTSFTEVSEEDVKGLIGRSSKKTCSLDPMPTSLVVESLAVLLPVITRMLNLSLQNGNFPDIWKLADVRPRPKIAAEALFVNLRLISNLQFASKLTERAVFCQIHDHLTMNRLYPKAQSAYREHHSTETALLRVKNDILLSMNQQRVTLLVLLDLSAAFDTVDHTILLNRLSSDFGISGKPYSWLDSYLRNRFQSISINGKTSTKFHTKYGVPQGSCLGPLLFVLYTSRLFKIIEHHLPEVHTYADDTQLYVSFSADSGFEQSAALEAMQSCIVDIRKWMLQDRLKLNDDKTEFIVIGTRQQLAKVNIDSLQVGESIVTAASKVINLGCWFDDQLKMDTHINNICRSAFFHLYNIRRIRKYLSSDCAQTLVNAFVTSRLDFCNSLLYGLKGNQLQKLQRVQNAAARVICNINRYEHISPSLYNLHWLPVSYRIQFKILLLVYKTLNGLAPLYLSELIELKKLGRYNLRTNSDTLLLKYPVFKSLTTLGDRSFTCAAPKLWNSLPKAIRNANNVNNFKRLLKTHLFRDAFSCYEKQ